MEMVCYSDFNYYLLVGDYLFMLCLFAEIKKVGLKGKFVS